jgi:hypothetical protein
VLYSGVIYDFSTIPCAENKNYINSKTVLRNILFFNLSVGPLVTTAWHVLGLRMEGMASSWRLAANILNKQPRANDKGWSSSLGVGRGANNPSP